MNLLKIRTATRLSFKWYGMYRKIESNHHYLMSETVDAQPKSIRAAKQLFNSKTPAIREINAHKQHTKEYWENSTTPYPDPGVRLLPKCDVDEFTAKMTNAQNDLYLLAEAVQNSREEILQDARERLGQVFNSNNYPDDLSSLFAMEYSFPSLVVPGDLPAHIYEQQKALAKAKLEEAIQLTQAAFTQEFAQLVASLADKLTPGADGTKKTFHASAITNINEFIDRFQKLSIGDNADLDKLVTQAKALVMGIRPEELRNLTPLRLQIADAMKDISTKLAPLVVHQPRRKLVLKPKDNQCQNENLTTEDLPKYSQETPILSPSDALFANVP